MSAAKEISSEIRERIERVAQHIDELGNEDLKIAFECGQKGAERIHHYYYAEAVEIEEKKGMHGDLVSIVDREIDESILKILQEKRPGDLILSEELQPELKPTEGKTGEGEGEGEESKQRLWIIDPLDGTVGFLFRASEEYPSTLIALRVGQHTEVAVVWFGVTHEIFYAIRGQGAYHNGAKLQVAASSAAITLEEAWIDMNQYSDARFESPAFDALRKALRSAEPRGARLVTTLPAHSGIACYIALARKRVHAIVHDNNPASVKQGPWDVAAPQLVLQEAGGVFLNARSGLPYDPLAPADIIVAAANPLLAQRLVELLHRFGHQSISS